MIVPPVMVATTGPSRGSGASCLTGWRKDLGTPGMRSAYVRAVRGPTGLGRRSGAARGGVMFRTLPRLIGI
ncbi:hypothetical protein Sm713_55310 [Streptomyces sp. TS71-3]|nr:hypothetical protein Sm713_55310 [Streptomyces sp. TS71-3]